MKKNQLKICVALLGGLSLLLISVPSFAANINLCPSSANWDNQSIRLQYLPFPGIAVPDIAGSLPTDQLEIQHSGVYPIAGLQQKALVPPALEVDSCTGSPGSGGTGYTGGACDGRLEVRVERDGMAITNGGVDVTFVEVNLQATQAALTFIRSNWPNCSVGTVPCAPTDPFVPQYAPLMDVVSSSRAWVNVNYVARVRLTNVTPTEIRTDTTVSTTPDEFLHLAVNPGPAISNSQWFAVSILDNGTQLGCVQISKILPIMHQ